MSMELVSKQKPNETKTFPVYRLALIASALIAAAPAPSAPLTGKWGGEGYSLRVVPTGAIVQAKCVSGKIEGNIVPDAAGAFAGTGYFNRDSSGYRLADMARRDRKADFSGKIMGSKLKLTIRAAGEREVAVVMVRGAKMKFPVCKV